MSMSLWGLWSTSARVSRIGHSGRLVIAVAGSGEVLQRPRHLSELAGLALKLLDVAQRHALYIDTGARALAPQGEAFADLPHRHIQDSKMLMVGKDVSVLGTF